MKDKTSKWRTSVKEIWRNLQSWGAFGLGLLWFRDLLHGVNFVGNFVGICIVIIVLRKTIVAWYVQMLKTELVTPVSQQNNFRELIEELQLQRLLKETK